MVAGDVAVTIVETPTAAEVDTALTALRVTGGSNGTYGAFSHDGVVFCWGITEA